MIQVGVHNETNTLKCVLLGRADHSGSNPTLEEAYDLKSRHHIEKGTYPKEEDLISQLDGMCKALEKQDVLVVRPDLIEGCNQIFARDIGFVIDDFFFLSNILPARAHELNAINEIIGQIPSQKIISCPSEVHVEGGDVIVYNDYVFVGYYDQEDYSGLGCWTNIMPLPRFPCPFSQSSCLTVCGLSFVSKHTVF